ncbi:carbohydrate ABC transporter permease [Prauserella cavernicola]|uniref:Sugar ABC transporter permease n=1 Tax=Prauserella cavernicola TaxID=2800127 RepID=A0A934V4Q4_9PSEU|nr:sugar ABC transporter permease [Prauserella cavernicola]MBK1783838.1 sugar ABC transporter permease [Prauserella cavernicola]
MVVPAVLVYVALLVVPVGYAFYYSFTEYNGFPTRVPEFIGLENYQTVFSSDDMTGTMVTTGVIAVIGALVVNLAALGLALLLQKPNRFNTFGRVVMFYPHVLSALVVGFLWQAILGPQGVVNTMLEKVGSDSLPFLSDPNWALWSMIFVIAWALFGVQLILYLAGLQAVSTDLLEAARIDGASRWQTFRSVTWPSLAPTVTAAIITSGISLLKTYDVVVSLTGGGPAGSTKTLAYQILAVSFPERDIGVASAQAVLLILAAAVLAITVLVIRRRAENDAESIG